MQVIKGILIIIKLIGYGKVVGIYCFDHLLWWPSWQPRRSSDARWSTEIITGYKVDKLWDDGSLIQTTQVEESMLLNCDRMEDGRVSILEEKPLLFVRNTLNLIKWNY
uniref:Bm9845 n=1 Tax=Brugia malayi TaxID=6279 RepID=A0A0H5S6M4_BRUMA|nr:Bm9845 [Brugia malayi]